MSWQAALRSKWGRAALVAVGVAVVAYVIYRLGAERIFEALRRSAAAFPLVFLLEGVIVTCTMLGLRTLYGPDRHKITAWDLTRAGLLGYVAMLLMPSGRTFAEATRATLLARRSTPSRAAFAAYQMQAACLLGNAMILSFAFAAAWWVLGFNGYVGAILANLGVCIVVGLGMLFGGRFVKVGGLLGRIFPKASEHGKAFDVHTLEHPAVPWVPALWEFAGRLFQTIQMMILVAAVGGRLSFLAGSDRRRGPRGRRGCGRLDPGPDRRGRGEPGRLRQDAGDRLDGCGRRRAWTSTSRSCSGCWSALRSRSSRGPQKRSTRRPRPS